MALSQNVARRMGMRDEVDVDDFRAATDPDLFFDSRRLDIDRVVSNIVAAVGPAP